MQVEHQNALFLRAEEKSFKNPQGDTIEYMHAYILGDDDEYIKATVLKDIQQDVLELAPRSEFSCVVSITERERSDGSTYLSKKITDIS